MQYLVDWIDIDEDEIHYRCWLTNQAKAWVVITHGLSEHSERYERIARFLNEQHINVICWDHLGHGEHSEQLSQLNTSFEKMTDRVTPILALCEKLDPNLKTFLLGHSMGSFMSLNYCTRNNPNIAGLILSGSGIDALGRIKTASVINRLLCQLFGKNNQSKFFDWLTFTSFNEQFEPNRSAFDWLSSIPEEVDLYLQDPYCGFIPSNGMWKEILSCLRNLEGDIKSHTFNFPILLQQGEYCSVANLKGGNKRLTTALSAKSNAIKSITYPDARHEIYNDHCAIQAMSDLCEWIGRQL